MSSVANEYSGYCTTPEEYAEQRYEGGHTLYGPRTQPFLAAHAARLAGEVAREGVVCDLLPDRAFDLHHRSYLPSPFPPAVARAVSGPATFTDATSATDPVWEQSWVDAAPGGLRWDAPLVRVEMADGHGDWVPAVAHGRPVDDGGCDIEVVHLGPATRITTATRPGGGTPAFAPAGHRFVLAAQEGRPEVAGDPFD